MMDYARQMGCSVHDTSEVGDGFGDFVIGYRGRNLIIEVKDGERPPSKRKLTPDQVEFHESWRGQKAVVKDFQELSDVISSDQSKYRYQKCKMMLREKKFAILGDPLPDGSYCVTVADGSCTREVLLPANPDIFAILEEILKLATRMQEQDPGQTKNT